MRIRVSAIFLIHGLIVSTWVSRIPAIQSALGLSPATLGLTLLMAAVGSLVSMPVAGILIDREGSGRVTAQASMVFSVSLPLIALAPNAWWLGAALFVYGVGAGAMDIGMNAQAVAVEDIYRRSIMSSFHALFSVGGMLGAGLGGLVAAAGVTPLPHMSVAGAALLAASVAAARNLVEDHHHPELAAPPNPRRVPLSAVGLAAIAFIFFMAEGVMADWTGIYLTDFLRAGPGTAALGYAAFSVTMAVGRVAGDGVIERLGRRRALEVCSLITAGGLAGAMAAPSVWLALAGFGLVGAGCSIIVPVCFAAAGRIAGLSKGVGMAAVTGAGYFGLLVGPPMVGFAAQAFTLRVALLIVVAMAVCGAVLARSVKEREG